MGRHQGRAFAVVGSAREEEFGLRRSAPRAVALDRASRVVTKPTWDFGYMPVASWQGDDDGSGCNLVVAVAASRVRADFLRALEPLAPGICVEELLARPPIFWWRLRS